MQATEASPEQMLELISFEIAGQEFCIDIRNVREIRGWAPATPIPHAPEHVAGVINLRGAVVPVVDLRNRLGLGRTEPSSRHVIVVIQDGPRIAGLLVDGVEETFRVSSERLQPPPAMDLGDQQKLLDAILPQDGRMLGRLIVSALFPDQDRKAA